MYRSNIELHNVDCLPFMKQCEDNQFDIAIVDPPYGIGRDGKPKSTSSHGGHKGYEFKGWDNAIPKKEYFDELFRISKNQIIWGGNYFSSFLPPSSGWVMWDKAQRLDQADGELAYTSFAKPLRIWTKNRVVLQQEGTIHPTQKPIKLYKWLLMNYAKERDKIFDSHLGSGSIAIACDDLGFDLTACEIDEDYFNKANKRLEPYRKQRTLF
jgi:site-specific DNA-methyltransferase (adenine-specific)